jgi:hypothetical protein
MPRKPNAGAIIAIGPDRARPPGRPAAGGHAGAARVNDRRRGNEYRGGERDSLGVNGMNPTIARRGRNLLGAGRRRWLRLSVALGVVGLSLSGCYYYDPYYGGPYYNGPYYDGPYYVGPPPIYVPPPSIYIGPGLWWGGRHWGRWRHGWRGRRGWRH